MGGHVDTKRKLLSHSVRFKGKVIRFSRMGCPLCSPWWWQKPINCCSDLHGPDTISSYEDDEMLCVARAGAVMRICTGLSRSEGVCGVVWRYRKQVKPLTRWFFGWERFWAAKASASCLKY